MGELREKITTQALVKKIPAEKCWEITAKILTGFLALRIILSRPLLGKSEDKGIIALLSGWEKHEEISDKVFGERAKRFYPWVKETFHIPVGDALEASKLRIVAATLFGGPEFTMEIVEATQEKHISRTTKCLYWEWNKEYEVNPKLMTCHIACQAMGEEGLKAVNPQLTYKLIKAMPWGDPYCEGLCEFKEE